MKLKWSARARRDLLAIGDRIAADKPVTALAFVERLRARALTAGGFPRSGRIVPEIQNPTIRELIEGSYRIVYRVERKVVSVLTVFEGHRLMRAQDIVRVPPSTEGRRRKKSR
ncbi:MAG: type II toxin-antitoxin system RelE/ParE family toxin [Planctomycetes bacterium]|nr:type II toxin-antitoxin system RelE/ParE family toxin [Planctomycetota bacterium]